MDNTQCLDSYFLSHLDFESEPLNRLPKMVRSNVFVLALLFALTVIDSEAFVVRPQACVTSLTGPLEMSEKEDDKLRVLGYSEDEIRRSRKESDTEEVKVRVDMVDDVDAVSLTAIGFGLIALNFFVFANMGDGGIAGLVASIINTLNQ